MFINFTNSATTSHTLELWTGEGTELDGIRVHRSTGGDYNTTAGTAGISTNSPGDAHTVSFLSFPEEVQLYGRYTLESGATRTWTMAEPYGQTVFVVLFAEIQGLVACAVIRLDDPGAAFQGDVANLTGNLDDVFIVRRIGVVAEIAGVTAAGG